MVYENSVLFNLIENESSLTHFALLSASLALFSAASASSIALLASFSALVLKRLDEYLYILDLYKVHARRLVRTFLFWMYMRMRGSMYKMAAYARNDLLSGIKLKFDKQDKLIARINISEGQTSS